MRSEKLMEGFSVTMPVCNDEKRMRNAVRSVLNQSFENFEFILSGFGETFSMISDFGDQRIRITDGKDDLQSPSSKYIAFMSRVKQTGKKNPAINAKKAQMTGGLIENPLIMRLFSFLLTVILLTSFSNIIAQNDKDGIFSILDSIKHQPEEILYQNGKRVIFNDTSKWHPEEFYIVWYDMRVKFKFPYEIDRTGVANLLFQCKKTGNVHLLDTVRNNIRFANRLLGMFDAILLYNNGKYVRCNDVFFEKNTSTEIDMENLDVFLPDSASQHWLSLRSFNAAIANRVVRKNYSTFSENKIRGYIFREITGVFAQPNEIKPMWACITASTLDGKKREAYYTSIHDAYIEYDIDEDIILPFTIFGVGCCKNIELNITKNSGLIIVLEEPLTEEDMRRTSAPLVKKNIHEPVKSKRERIFQRKKNKK